jgi:uncharacterized protein (TIGR00159 family)
MDAFFSFLGSIRWQDIVDIIINSYIIFRLYIIFRGTNAFRVLIGIALLWFFQRITVSLGLIITSWAIQAITAVAAIIIIVVFRNEIRSVLLAKNLKTLLWGFPHKQVLTPIEIIVEGVFELAKKNTGALIVLPGKEDIKEIVRSGIPWQGIVSMEMIMSVFWHDNPVHDGAIIITGNRISEVGVILPLSYRKNVPSYYGTRHRAALGLTENTDAMAIVVSEEQGNVLVAQNGAMNAAPRKDVLKQILQEHTGAIVKPREFYKNENFEITVAALLSFFIVFSIWFSFFRGMETRITLQTPIDYMNRDPKVEILDTSVNSLKLSLSGSGPLIKSIGPEQVMVRIDLGQATVGNNTFTIGKKNITLPPGVKLNRVDPSHVKVLLDLPIKKKVPIQASWSGKLPEHLILVRATITPEKIELIGRNQILSNISTIYTEKVFLDKIKKSGSITVGLAVHPDFLKAGPGKKDKVTINYEVKVRK